MFTRSYTGCGQSTSTAARPGVTATAAPPSEAIGAAVEPDRARQRSSAARHRAWRVTGGTIWPARNKQSAAACAEHRSVRQVGVVHVPREGNQAHDPRARERAASNNRCTRGLTWMFSAAIKAQPAMATKNTCDRLQRRPSDREARFARQRLVQSFPGSRRPRRIRPFSRQ